MDKNFKVQIIVDLSKKLHELGVTHCEDTHFLLPDTCKIINWVLRSLNSIVVYLNNSKWFRKIFNQKREVFKEISKHINSICDFNILKDFNKNELTSIISEIFEDSDNEKIERNIKNIYLIIDKYREQEKLKSIYLEASDYIENLTIEDILEFYDDFKNISHDDCLDRIMKRQEEINNIPNITKEDFFEKYPEVESLIDKDDLINISSSSFPTIKSCNPDGIYLDEYFIYYDKIYSDMGMINYFGPDFLDFFNHLLNAYKDKKTDFKIKLDLEKIISIDNYKRISLLGWTYFWPNYSEREFFTEWEKVLFTRKQRLNIGFMEYFNNDITYTDFYLDQKKNAFMIEEIWENNYKTEFFINRFTHSEININKRNISHFDGSLFYYDSEKIKKRETVNLSEMPKLSFKKCKIFRIDGELEMKDFIFINLLFFNDNEMVLEYFDKDCYDKVYSHILDYKWGVDY